MNSLRLELSNEQTLRLEELRQTLAEALPADRAEMTVFPVAHYGSCGGTCFIMCDGTCWGRCVHTCWYGCDFGCLQTCWNYALDY